MFQVKIDNLHGKEEIKLQRFEEVKQRAKKYGKMVRQILYRLYNSGVGERRSNMLLMLFFFIFFFLGFVTTHYQ